MLEWDGGNEGVRWALAGVDIFGVLGELLVVGVDMEGAVDSWEAVNSLAFADDVGSEAIGGGCAGLGIVGYVGVLRRTILSLGWRVLSLCLWLASFLLGSCGW